MVHFLYATYFFLNFEVKLRSNSNCDSIGKVSNGINVRLYTDEIS